MLRFVSFSLIAIVMMLLIGGFSLTAAPYYFYFQIVENNKDFEWYAVNGDTTNIVSPLQSKTLKEEFIENETLWSKFHFSNHMLPIPVKNPYFFVAPIFNFDKKSHSTNLGISISNASKVKIAEVFFLPRFEIPTPSRGQRLFEFPIVANEMKKFKTKNVWKDLFAKDLSNWKISTEEMIYNLYLLDIRSALFDQNMEDFYYLEGEDKAVTVMKYKDKDYLSEIIFSRRGKTIYPILILTQKNNEEAQRIRYKVIKDLEFINTTASLADIIYREFKNLKYKAQTDHEGMLYLLSAWSHRPSSKELLVEAIHYLERGKGNQKQLEELYEYMFTRYGRTFAQKEVFGLNLKSEILLKLREEIEKFKDDKNKLKLAPTPQRRKSVSEEFNEIIESTKDKVKDSNRRIRMN